MNRNRTAKCRNEHVRISCAMQAFVSQIACAFEVSVAADADHIIHLNAGRFFGPFSDVMPRETIGSRFASMVFLAK